jgi:lysophospholipase L1-like esterase
VDETNNSNAIRLSGRQWLCVAIFGVALVSYAPRGWERAEPLPADADSRIPYDLSNGYWLYERRARQAAERNDVLLIGDSVVWGQYVARDQTLSHYLNARAGSAGLRAGMRFANLGLDGAHPIALSGLLEHYAPAVRNQDVILHCNPLWLSSARHDLSAAEEFRFNHPELAPQFVPWIPCYKEDLSRRIGNAVGRNVPFIAWTSHLQLAYFDKMNIPAWTLEHPDESPLTPLKSPPVAEDRPRHEPISWTERGITPQDMPWVAPAVSLQWRAFQEAVATLQRRGNRVFVLVGPFNEHLLTERSRNRYRTVAHNIEDWLTANGIPHCAPPPLPSELYADASHPLSGGYRLLAEQLLQAWQPDPEQ